MFGAASLYHLREIKIEPKVKVLRVAKTFIGETTGKTTLEKILVLLRIQPSIMQRLLAAELGVSANSIKYHIDKMKFEGLIRHVGASIGFLSIT